MSKLLVYFEVETEHFGQIMGAIGPSMATVQNLRVETGTEKIKRQRVTSVVADNPEQPFVNRSDRLINGQRIRVHKNSKIEKLIMDELGGQPGIKVPYKDLEAAAQKIGFSPKSISPAITNLVKQGKIERGNKKAWIFLNRMPD